jgi:hypothetical protein
VTSLIFAELATMGKNEGYLGKPKPVSKKKQASIEDRGCKELQE